MCHKIWEAVTLISVMFVVSGCAQNTGYEPKDADIIFQTSRSAQSLAIQKATKSRYSHMGIIFVNNGNAVVLEAVEPVRSTPLKDWIDRGEGGHYVVKRLTDAQSVLTPDTIKRMKAIGRQFEGKHYDLVFDWSDDRMYCSELVWKIYKRALDIEIGRQQRFKEFDLSDPLVQAKLQERYGNDVPENEIVVSPGAIFEFSRLCTVHQE